MLLIISDILHSVSTRSEARQHADEPWRRDSGASHSRTSTAVFGVI